MNDTTLNEQNNQASEQIDVTTNTETEEVVIISDDNASNAPVVAEPEIDYKDLYLREKAETENVRKRSFDEVYKARKFAIERFAEELLPCLDGLEAGAKITVQDAQHADVKLLREGLELSLKQLQNSLEKFGVKAIVPNLEGDEKLDPNKHQAIGTIPDTGKPNQTIIQVLQKGYTLNERLVRPALVMVAG